jgi:hypothetical protein
MITRRKQIKLYYTKRFTKEFRWNIEQLKKEIEIDGRPSEFVAGRVFWNLVVIRDRLSNDVYEAVKAMYSEELESASEFLQKPIP